MNFGGLEHVFGAVKLFGEMWIIPVILSLAISLMLTKKPKEIGTLFLPIIVGMSISGVVINNYIYMGLVTFGGFIFLINTLSYDIISSTISAGVKGLMSIKPSRQRKYERFESEAKMQRKRDAYDEKLTLEQYDKTIESDIKRGLIREKKPSFNEGFLILEDIQGKLLKAEEENYPKR